jgi:hypothetical protein
MHKRQIIPIFFICVLLMGAGSCGKKKAPTAEAP